MHFKKIEVHHLMLNDKPNVMAELAPKGPRSVEIIETMDSECSLSRIFSVFTYVLEQVSNVTLSKKNWIISASASQK